MSSVNNDIKLTSSMEDYIEAIYNISKENKVVRVKDIARKLDVKMPSVTSMIKLLGERGLLVYEKYGYLELTKKGKLIGSGVDEKHKVLREFLVEILRIDYEQADKDACGMEHNISSTTLKALVDFLEFIKHCPWSKPLWLDHFDEYRTGNLFENREKCLKHMKDIVANLTGVINKVTNE